MIRRAALALAGALLALAPPPPGAELPIFDAHIHYSPPDWDAFPPERALSILARAGVHPAIVPSPPDDGTLKLYARAPQSIVRFLWAHAGMSAGASTVARLLDRFPKLWVDLAFRTDVAPGGALDPDWRKVFLRYPDRFMVGTDTWVTSRWEVVRDYMRDVQVWLGQLPPDVAEQIAFKNGDRLFPAP